MKVAGVLLLLLASVLIPAGRIRSLEREKRAARDVCEFLQLASTEISCRACPADEMVSSFWNGDSRRRLTLDEIAAGIQEWGKAGDIIKDYVSLLSRATVEEGIRLTGVYRNAAAAEEERLSRTIELERKLRLPLYPTVLLILVLLLW